MKSKPKKGDHVAWDTSQGETTGRVVKRLTSKTKIKEHTAKPSKGAPNTWSEVTRAERRPLTSPKNSERSSDYRDDRSVGSRSCRAWQSRSSIIVRATA